MLIFKITLTEMFDFVQKNHFCGKYLPNFCHKSKKYLPQIFFFLTTNISHFGEIRKIFAANVKSNLVKVRGKIF